MKRGITYKLYYHGQKILQTLRVTYGTTYLIWSHNSIQWTNFKNGLK